MRKGNVAPGQPSICWWFPQGLTFVIQQNAYIWIYPKTREHTVVQGEEHFVYRTFEAGIQRKAFCKHCGVPLLNEHALLTGASGMGSHLDCVCASEN